jgi:hypothetical protein
MRREISGENEGKGKTIVGNMLMAVGPQTGDKLSETDVVTNANILMYSLDSHIVLTSKNRWFRYNFGYNDIPPVTRSRQSKLLESACSRNPPKVQFIGRDHKSLHKVAHLLDAAIHESNSTPQHI